MLLAALLILSINVGATEKSPQIVVLQKKTKVTTRTPLEFELEIVKGTNCISILFLSDLPNANICVSDKNGKTVISETNSDIYIGKTLIINSPNEYPYYIEIISPTMEIIGEIGIEE